MKMLTMSQILCPELSNKAAPFSVGGEEDLSNRYGNVAEYLYTGQWTRFLALLSNLL